MLCVRYRGAHLLERAQWNAAIGEKCGGTYASWNTFLGRQFVERVAVERTNSNPDCGTHVVECMHSMAYVAHTVERMH